ncbi:uncharacterized protein LOC126736368 [Anthonomus grandis grandis]|uniref:uncharacterized protein LOC126736368 n=1 Tax=Anthonomus grandis grandis TaxID=2921223 RepID=UPI0021663A22|nr:uncharacterized protein LOC126736368 [Anthonomus grandis grandis]
MRFAKNKCSQILYLLYLRRKHRLAQNKREYWIHPLLQVRYVEGAFYILFEKLRLHSDHFFHYFRLSITTFDFILERINMRIQKQDSVMRLCVPPNEMLAVSLRYLASGNTFRDLHYTYRLGEYTIRNIVKLVCRTIWVAFHEEYLPLPNQEKFLEIADGFRKTAQSPNCIGAVDGKHVRVNKFSGSGSMNLNYKGYFSIVLMAVVDSDYRFTFIDVGAYGKDCDSSVFQETNFWKFLQRGELNIPEPRPLHHTLSETAPFVVVGDAAFALNKNLLRPYGGYSLSIEIKVFNYRLIRARRFVECAFGILANKWRIFHRPMNVSKYFCRDIVKASIALHNLVRLKDGSRVANDDIYSTPSTELRSPSTKRC